MPRDHAWVGLFFGVAVWLFLLSRKPRKYGLQTVQRLSGKGMGMLVLFTIIQRFAHKLRLACLMFLLWVYLFLLCRWVNERSLYPPENIFGDGPCILFCLVFYFSDNARAKVSIYSLRPRSQHFCLFFNAYCCQYGLPSVVTNFGNLIESAQF